MKIQSYKGKIRDICHGVKENDPVAVREMADYFSNLDIINKDTLLIPAPQHQGFAIYTKSIAEIVAENTGASVLDILRCNPHETLYHQKKRGQMQRPVMYLHENIRTGKQLYFVDNVIDTGVTFRAANALFNGALKPLVFACA